MGIIGHNGAGKSTLLKLISRVTVPTSGRIGLNGRVASMLEVGTGFHGELTGRENIYMNGAILGMKKKEIDAKIEDIIEFSECRQFIDTPVKRYSSGMYVKLAFSVAAHLDSEIMIIDTPVKRYSSGMYVKLAFAVAAHLDAEIMIMDEVLAVGDMKFQEKCLGKMDDVSHSDGRTILYVSHNMSTIRKLCKRCIVLNQGKKEYDGDVEKAITIYMQSIKVSDSTVELGPLERSEMFRNPAVMMQKLLIHADSSVFPTGSTIKGSLYVSSEKLFGNVRLEIPIRSTGGVSVTRFLSSSNIVLAEKENRIDFMIDISRIAPGRYTMNPVLREVNSLGTTNNLDGLIEAYCFEIVPSDDFSDGTEWNSYYSGYYIAPPIILYKGE